MCDQNAKTNNDITVARYDTVNNIRAVASEEETEMEAARKVARPMFSSQVWDINFLLYQTGSDFEVYYV